MERFPQPPFPRQKQEMPGTTDQMQPLPDHGENSYQGSGRLRDKRAIITGGGQRYRQSRGARLRPGGSGCPYQLSERA